MKKFLVLILLLATSVFVVACDETTVDTVKPVFSGINSVEMNVGGTFDPRAGVTATDDVDGDLTAKNYD